MACSLAIETSSTTVHAAVVVAHPDDEILWCGGLILSHLDWRWWIVTLCRASDSDRAPRFRRVLGCLGAGGHMADLDDGPDQGPLDPVILNGALLGLVHGMEFDLVLTHGPSGEYTRHLRHEECSRAVIRLWQAGQIVTNQVWLFSYDDRGGATLPQVSEDADLRQDLDHDTWLEKYRLITGFYGFPRDSWEARCTPRVEGFRVFLSPGEATDFLESTIRPP